MRKVVIPTDFSDNSLNAIKYATELFKNERSEIYVIHAYADEVYEAKAKNVNAVFEDLKEESHQNSKEKLQKMCDEIMVFSPNPRHNIHLISEFGLLVDSVNDLVENENIDIVVMGTKGETGYKGITFGSNTLQVIKYVKCPVLAIPAHYDDVHPKNILFPTDFQLPYKRRELKLLSTISRCFASKIQLLYVTKFPSLSLRQTDNKEFLEKAFCDNKFGLIESPEDDVTISINKYILENPIDMLVMVNTRSSYLENILFQSTIEKIGLKIDIPFLVLQNLPR